MACLRPSGARHFVGLLGGAEALGLQLVRACTRDCCALLHCTAAQQLGAGEGSRKGPRIYDTRTLKQRRADTPAPAQRTSKPATRYGISPAQLTKQITSCTSREELLTLVDSCLKVDSAGGMPRFNDIHVSAALITLTKLQPPVASAADARLLMLVEAAEALMNQMKPRELSNTLYACSKLPEVVLSERWLAQYWRASADKLPQFDPQAFSNTLYACGQLGIVPPDDWLLRYWQASAAALPQFSPQALCNALYAFGQLGIVPPDDWLRLYWRASAAALPHFIPQAFSNTLYACGQLGIVPPDDWQQQYWRASAAALPQFDPQAFSNTLYACGLLGIVPPDDWQQRFWQASAAALPQFYPQAFSNTLYACGQLGIVPPDDWLQRYWQASAAALPQFDPQNFSNTLYACGQLGIVPPDDWLQRYWQASAAALPQSKPQELSNTLYACGQLGVVPPKDWQQQCWRASAAALPRFIPQAFSNTLYAIAALQLWDSPLLLQLWEQSLSLALRFPAMRSEEERLQLNQLYQVHVLAAAERPGLLSVPSPVVLNAARAVWRDEAFSKTRASALQDSVSECLSLMGIAHTPEHRCERSERSIDVAIVGGAQRIALEVDGPSHFLQSGQSNGRTQMRNRCLAAYGWRVVVVPFREWNALRTQTERQAYLSRLLA